MFRFLKLDTHLMKRFALGLYLLFLGIMTSCASPDQLNPTQQSESSREPIARRELAAVESIEIRQIDTFPVRVVVTVKGHLPDLCTIIDQISQNKVGGDFQIRIDSVRYDSETCTAQRIPFEEQVELDTLNLSPGFYVVDVNGLQGTFSLTEANIPDEANAVIGGRIREDVCSITLSTDGDAIVPSEKCVDLENGEFRANGIIEPDEPGLGGIIVDLGVGLCPATGLASTVTDAEGFFLLGGLRAGVYCVSINTKHEANKQILASGKWTYPPLNETGAITIEVDRGESRLDINLGWDFEDQLEFEPPPVENCTDKALFKEDVSIPDDTEITAGEVFTKTWRLQNIGSCTWGDDYSLNQVISDSIDSQVTVPISTTVFPGDEVELSVRFTAPFVVGVYRSEWMLQNPEGIMFGIGPGSDRAFWVQIEVVEVSENDQAQ